jgi:predicted lysophospholipase L1 biosynthesis ABC-type transport system permease subunit
MALGARRHQILELIIARAMKVVAIGLVVGFVLALVGARLLTSLLYGIEPTDPLTLLGVGALLALVALLASLAGARKGAAVPPAATLRAE